MMKGSDYGKAFGSRLMIAHWTKPRLMRIKNLPPGAGRTRLVPRPRRLALAASWLVMTGMRYTGRQRHTDGSDVPDLRCSERFEFGGGRREKKKKLSRVKKKQTNHALSYRTRIFPRTRLSTGAGRLGSAQCQGPSAGRPMRCPWRAPRSRTIGSWYWLRLSQRRPFSAYLLASALADVNWNLGA